MRGRRDLTGQCRPELRAGVGRGLRNNRSTFKCQTDENGGLTATSPGRFLLCRRGDNSRMAAGKDRRRPGKTGWQPERRMRPAGWAESRNRRTTHVDAPVELSQDRGSIPRASTIRPPSLTGGRLAIRSEVGTRKAQVPGGNLQRQIPGGNGKQQVRFLPDRSRRGVPRWRAC